MYVISGILLVASNRKPAQTGSNNEGVVGSGDRSQARLPPPAPFPPVQLDAAHASILPALGLTSIDLHGVTGQHGAGWVQGKSCCSSEGSGVTRTRGMVGGGWPEKIGSHHSGRGISLGRILLGCLLPSATRQ